jgi:hypothetical protein
MIRETTRTIKIFEVELTEEQASVLLDKLENADAEKTVLHALVEHLRSALGRERSRW